MFVKKRDVFFGREEESPNFWISYSDIMAALILIFILLLSLVILDYHYSVIWFYPVSLFDFCRLCDLYAM